MDTVPASAVSKKKSLSLPENNAERLLIHDHRTLPEAGKCCDTGGIPWWSVTGAKEWRPVTVADFFSGGRESSSRVDDLKICLQSATALLDIGAREDALPEARAFTIVLRNSASWRPPLLPSIADTEAWRTNFQSNVYDKRESAWSALQNFEANRTEGNGWRLHLTFSGPVGAGEIVDSFCRALNGHKLTTRDRVDGPAGAGVTVDVLDDTALSAVPARRAIVDMQHLDSESRSPMRSISPFDIRSINPIGFQRFPSSEIGILTGSRNLIWVGQAEQQLATMDRGMASEYDIEKLRNLESVDCTYDQNCSPEAFANAIARLSAAGIPLTARELGAVAQVIGDDLAKEISGCSPETLSDPLTREVHSIRLRRTGLRTHGAQYSRGGMWHDLSATDSTSVVICSRRPGFIAHAVEQVMLQRGVAFELVIGLHGLKLGDLESGVRRTLADAAIRVEEIPQDVPFGGALNELVSRANGSWIAKMDDDDWYGAQHLADLDLSRNYSGADMVGFRPDLVYLEASGQTVLRGIRDTERFSGATSVGIVSCGTLLFSRSIFEAAGGFRPVRTYEDGELCTDIRAVGGRIYCQHGLNYLQYRRGNGQDHTSRAEDSVYLNGSVRSWKGRYVNDLMADSRGL